MKTVVLLCSVVVLGAAYYYHKQRHKPFSSAERKINPIGRIDDINVETVDEIKLQDVKSYFNGINLFQGRDIPFIARADKIKDLIHFPDNIKTNNAILIASFNEETSRIENYRLLVYKNLDSELLKLLGDEKLVVLS